MMINVDNQRPGDLWIINGIKYEITESPESDENGQYLFAKVTGTDVVAIIAVLPRSGDLIGGIARLISPQKYATLVSEVS